MEENNEIISEIQKLIVSLSEDSKEKRSELDKVKKN